MDNHILNCLKKYNYNKGGHEELRYAMNTFVTAYDKATQECNAIKMLYDCLYDEVRIFLRAYERGEITLEELYKQLAQMVEDHSKDPN